jgi:hypothetical protein
MAVAADTPLQAAPDPAEKNYRSTVINTASLQTHASTRVGRTIWFSHWTSMAFQIKKKQNS